MKVSARNFIPGKVKAVTMGMVNAEIDIEVAPGIEIVSVITKQSAESMGLKVGSSVNALIKASNVVVVSE